MKTCFVYIMSSLSRRTYIGMTSNLEARVYQHKNKVFLSHTATYNVDRLVRVEEYGNVDDAIARERQLKRWTRKKKVWLIEQENPEWVDLSGAWFR